MLTGPEMSKKANIQNLSIKSLIELREQVDQALLKKRQELEQQIAVLARLGNGRRSLRGRHIAPKYRDSEGNTWAGRGARPKWLVAELKKGRKLDSFLIK